MQRKLALTGLILTALLMILHYLALDLFWYWTYRWFDIPIHFLGGLIVGVLALYLSNIIFGNSKFLLGTLPYILIIVLFVGVLWEIFEVFVGIEIHLKSGYEIDTIIDLAMDVLGGLVAFFLFQTKDGK